MWQCAIMRLTPQEFQIARFVSQFSKLGIASRTELATLTLDAHAPARPAA